jgi:hypothetical protein
MVGHVGWAVVFLTAKHNSFKSNKIPGTIVLFVNISDDENMF